MLCFQLNALQEFFKVFYAILRIPGVHCLKVVVRLHLDQVPWIEPGGKVHILTNIQCLFNKTLGVFLCSQRNDFSFKLLYLSCYFFPPHCCSVTQSCLTLCDPRDSSTPGFPVYHHLPEFAQTHVHWVSDAIQPSHSLLLLPSIFPSIRVFSNEHQVAKVLEL